MNKYFAEFLNITTNVSKNDEKKKLLLHACCAPCSSAALESVVPFFTTDIFFYNPNITLKEEYEHRLSEELSFVDRVYGKQVKVFEGEYEPQRFFEIAKNYESIPEGGERCFLCYKLRLEKTAEYAKKYGYDYFASTLSVSRYKNSDKLNEIGYEIGEKYSLAYLPTDFKKRGGYERSIKLSEMYGLYRQNYCGCIYSQRQRELYEQERKK